MLVSLDRYRAFVDHGMTYGSDSAGRGMWRSTDIFPVLQNLTHMFSESYDQQTSNCSFINFGLGGCKCIFAKWVYPALASSKHCDFFHLWDIYCTDKGIFLGCQKQSLPFLQQKCSGLRIDEWGELNTFWVWPSLNPLRPKKPQQIKNPCLLPCHNLCQPGCYCVRFCQQANA